MGKEIFKTIALILCIAVGLFVLSSVLDAVESRPKEIHCTYCGETISSEDALCAYCYFKEDQYDKLRDMVKEEAIDIYTMVDVLWDLWGYDLFENALESRGAMVFPDELAVEEYVRDQWTHD